MIIIILDIIITYSSFHYVQEIKLTVLEVLLFAFPILALFGNMKNKSMAAHYVSLVKGALYHFRLYHINIIDQSISICQMR